MRATPIIREVRKREKARLDDGTRRIDLKFWGILALLYVVVVLLTSSFYLQRPPAPDANGRMAFLPVVAETDFSFIHARDRTRFEAERLMRSPQVWRFDPDAGGEVLRQLEEVFRAADQIDLTASGADQVAFLRKLDSRLVLNEDRVTVFLQRLRDPRFREAIRSTVRDAYNEGVVVENLVKFRADRAAGVFQVSNATELSRTSHDPLARALPYPFDSFEWRRVLAPQFAQRFSPGVDLVELNDAAGELLVLLQPSLRHDRVATQRAFDEFEPTDLYTDYFRGDILIGREAEGRDLTADEVNLLAAHAAAVRTLQNKRLLGHMAYTLVVFLLATFYLRKFSRSEDNTVGLVALLATPILLGLMVMNFYILLADGETAVVGYLFPAGAIGMLGVLLMEVRIALLMVTCACLLFGLQVNLNYEFVVIGLFGGYTGVAALYTIRKRWEVFLASLMIGLANAGVILILAFIQDPSAMLPLGAAGLGLVAGIGSFLVLAILPIFERFGVVTDMQLLELTGLQHPLLRSLEELAPGSWQHTLNVTKLAEAAAREIGVNYLLLRAGCYFHDIGKMKKPDYFTENQITSEEKGRHNELKPELSTLVIKNHVKEGVEMAQAAGLPDRIIDFIRQHHGTSVITYFYHKALDLQNRGMTKDPVRIEDYRYPGPKPQTIEAAIVMLADSVEATATAKLSGRSVRVDDIQQVVRTTIFEKFNDGQFDECNLTLRDLNIIREVFVKTLISRFHTRIDYPKKAPATAAPRPTKEERKPEPTSTMIQKVDASSGSESSSGPTGPQGS